MVSFYLLRWPPIHPCMQDVFFIIASGVLLECGYFLWLLIDKERMLRREDMYDEATLIGSIREEFGDGTG